MTKWARAGGSEHAIRFAALHCGNQVETACFMLALHDDGMGPLNHSFED